MSESKIPNLTAVKVVEPPPIYSVEAVALPLTSLSEPRVCIVSIARGATYLGLVIDEETAVPCAVADDFDYDMDEEPPYDAERFFADSFATQGGEPLKLERDEADRVLAAVDRAVAAARTQLLTRILDTGDAAVVVRQVVQQPVLKAAGDNKSAN